MALRATVWVGTSTSREALEEFLLGERSCDGDPIGDLARAQRRELIDATREYRRVETETVNVRELLEGLSFAEVLLGELPPVLPRPCNTAVIFFGVDDRPGQLESPRVTLSALQRRNST